MEGLLLKDERENGYWEQLGVLHRRFWVEEWLTFSNDYSKCWLEKLSGGPGIKVRRLVRKNILIIQVMNNDAICQGDNNGNGNKHTDSVYT